MDQSRCGVGTVKALRYGTTLDGLDQTRLD